MEHRDTASGAASLDDRAPKSLICRMQGCSAGAHDICRVSASCLTVQLQPDALDLGIQINGFFAHFTPVTALFVTAKGRSCLGIAPRIDPDGPGAQCPG